MSESVIEIKANALAKAEQMLEAAKAVNDPDLFDKAAQYFYTAGKNKEANECWDAADALRKGTG